METQTLVLDINELYKVIPETQSLEGTNFKNIRELLKSLIEKIEETGDWEFIQHIQNKPSLFIIRKVEGGNLNEKIKQVADIVAKDKLKKLENKLNVLSDILSKISSSSLPVNKTILLPGMESVINKIEEMKEEVSIYDNELFKKESENAIEKIGMDETEVKIVDKLPWE